MSRLRGNAALHCVITTAIGREPEVRHYLAVYTEDLDHYTEVPLTRQQWMLLLTTALPTVYFDQTGDANGQNETKPTVEGHAHSQECGRYVRASDARIRQQHAQAGVADSRQR